MKPALTLIALSLLAVSHANASWLMPVDNKEYALKRGGTVFSVSIRDSWFSPANELYYQCFKKDNRNEGKNYLLLIDNEDMPTASEGLAYLVFQFDGKTTLTEDAIKSARMSSKTQLMLQKELEIFVDPPQDGPIARLLEAKGHARVISPIKELSHLIRTITTKDEVVIKRLYKNHNGSIDTRFSLGSFGEAIKNAASKGNCLGINDSLDPES